MTVRADETHMVDMRLTVIKPLQRAKIKFIKCCGRVKRTLIIDGTLLVQTTKAVGVVEQQRGSNTSGHRHVCLTAIDINLFHFNC